MEENRLSANVNFTAESAHLVKTLLYKHRHTITTEQEEKCPDTGMRTEEEHHTFYHYRARFSTPTSRKPIQGTASVYFVVDVSKVKAQTLPVEVLFVVESNRLVHTPGRTRFREKWLADVIESKALLQKAVQL
uniref:Uncharacterized protein n=1 Tax=Lates calcarifer TaxID=8187 RepID=A0A4W6DBS5_LATCA